MRIAKVQKGERKEGDCGQENYDFHSGSFRFDALRLGQFFMLRSVRLVPHGSTLYKVSVVFKKIYLSDVCLVGLDYTNIGDRC